MSAASSLQAVKNKVKMALMEVPERRDNDQLLTLSIWWSEIKSLGCDPKKISAFEMMCMYRDGKLTMADTITRIRRLLQDEFPALRGALWQKRRGDAEDVKQLINDEKNKNRPN